MSNSNTDDLNATGRYRTRISEGGDSSAVARAGRDPAAAQRHWLTQGQTGNPRHAAITRALYNWPSYRSWAEKVKHGWTKDEK